MKPERRRIVFLTGTRADFGKLKSLMLAVRESQDFEEYVFATGMHMAQKYGYTVREVEKAGFQRIYTFINHHSHDTQDAILAKTIAGFSDYTKEIDPDLIVVHGDRPEALSGAIVGCFNNYLVAHIEGGEVSGTIDGLIRHAVTKLSHIHFVANALARQRVRQMGERDDSIFEIGSPDIDVMMSDSLPTIDVVMKRYEIEFAANDYAVALFHPVTTELDTIGEQVRELVEAMRESGLNFIVIYPNNDPGTQTIIDEYRELNDLKNFRVINSMRFEYFLSLLKHSRFIIGNSSAGIREAPLYGLPSVNIGTRQFQRADLPSIVSVVAEKKQIADAIIRALALCPTPVASFGDGNSSRRFMEIIRDERIWSTPCQKYFVDQEVSSYRREKLNDEIKERQ